MESRDNCGNVEESTDLKKIIGELGGILNVDEDYFDPTGREKITKIKSDARRGLMRAYRIGDKEEKELVRGQMGKIENILLLKQIDHPIISSVIGVGLISAPIVAGVYALNNTSGGIVKGIQNMYYSIYGLF